MPGDVPLKHKPFASLRGAAIEPRAPEPGPPSSAAAPSLPSLGRLIVREEFDKVDGALVRVIGLPPGRPDAMGKQLRRALGFAVAIEGRDLLVMSDEFERVAGWFRAEGGEVVLVRRQPPVDLARLGAAGGTRRAEIRRGLRVAVVLKADQPSGALTEGIVRDILTSSAEHPRGIKVRLESGDVGRVQRILGG